VEGLWPSCLLRAMWPSGSQGIPGPLSHLRGHVAVCHFEGAMCVGPHLPFFGVMWPFGLFRSHVAIWPSAENDQPRKNCSLLIKSSYENVISWPGLALGLSEDFLRPNGDMATWSLKKTRWQDGRPLKGLDGQAVLQKAQMATWPIKRRDGHTWPFKGLDGHMAP
jgi:hypothetical protein